MSYIITVLITFIIFWLVYRHAEGYEFVKNKFSYRVDSQFNYRYLMYTNNWGITWRYVEKWYDRKFFVSGMDWLRVDKQDIEFFNNFINEYDTYDKLKGFMEKEIREHDWFLKFNESKQIK